MLQALTAGLAAANALLTARFAAARATRAATARLAAVMTFPRGTLALALPLLPLLLATLGL